MTKLNDKDQWLLSNATVSECHAPTARVLKRSVVENHLIRKQTEIDELKAHINRQGEYIETINSYMYTEYSEEFQFEYAPQQSLADHDKQVKIETLEQLLDWGADQTYNNWIVNPMNGVHRPPVQSIRNNGYVIQSSQIERYINQLKDK